MKRKIPFSVFAATSLLVIYSVLIFLDAPLRITGFVFFISPFFIGWMIISVLKDKSYPVKELEENEEWGYGDKRKEDLGIF